MGNRRVDPRRRFDRWGSSGLYGGLHWLSFGASGQRLRAQLVAALGLAPGAAVLDVATGTGATLPLLAGAVGPAGRVVGLDLSPGMLDRARPRVAGLPQVELRVGDASRLPFADATFDAVVSSYGISCVAEPTPVLDELLRVLRPDGVLGVADARSVNWRPEALARLATAAAAPFNAWYPERDLAAILAARGLDVTRAATERPALTLTLARRAEAVCAAPGGVRPSQAMEITRHHTNARMSQTVVHGDTVYLAGQVCPEPVPEDVAGQTKAILGRIDELLAEVGSDRTKALMATIWLTDIATFDEMNAEWDAWVPEGHAPARACVESALAVPKYKVEIRIVAGR